MTAGLPRQLEVFANRSLDLAAIDAIGYDMDYTLVYYRVEEWERAAFEHARDRLNDRGWPVTDTEFDPTRFTIGLTFDVDLGNLVKATRFGRVVRAQHGDRKLDVGGASRGLPGHGGRPVRGAFRVHEQPVRALARQPVVATHRDP